ncbi:UNVERIFIED_ORG: hypothetical protein CLV66_111186 [Actinomadura viridilutea]
MHAGIVSEQRFFTFLGHDRMCGDVFGNGAG